MLSTGVRAATMVLCVFLVLEVYWPVASAAPEPGQLANVAEALRYLQELDNYYSKVARPRFGRSLPIRTPEQDVAAAADERKSFMIRRR